MLSDELMVNYVRGQSASEDEPKAILLGYLSDRVSLDRGASGLLSAVADEKDALGVSRTL